MDSLREDAHSPEPKKRGPDFKTSYHTKHAVTMEVQREVLWKVDKVRRDAGATFPRSTGPMQPWPSFFSAAEERSCRPSSNRQL